jgi:hypothetical protein
MQALSNTLSAPSSLPWVRRPARALVRELLHRQRMLTVFAGLLLVAIVPVTVGWGLDERTLRGVSVWVKPIKFMLSIAALALTTAWFIGYLRADRRRSPGVRAIVFALVVSGAFEIGYITLQAALGGASHYNVADAFHAAMYMLMGVGALVLTGTQAALAWQLVRHPDPDVPPAFRHAVVLGLALTFALGAGVGIPLSALQPPSIAGVPFLGWSPSAGDLRPAHFVGIHAEQLLPLAGAFASARLRNPVAWIRAFAALYGVLCIALAAYALLSGGAAAG